MVRLIAALQKGIKAYKEGGFLLVLKRAGKRLYRTNSAYWFIRDLSAPIPEFSAPFVVNVVKNQTEQVIKYMEKKNYLSEKEIEVGMKEGHWFLGLIVNEQVMGFCKCGFKRVYVNDFNEVLQLPDKISFIYEYEIDETIRGKGIAKYFISSVLKMLKYDEWRFAVCHIPPWNTPSIKVIEACGFKRLEWIKFIEFAGLKWKSKRINTLLEIIMKNEVFRG